MTLSPCLPNSAWRAWQNAGRDWRAINPNGNYRAAAGDFAALSDYPATGQSARYRAFMEGAATTEEKIP